MKLPTSEKPKFKRRPKLKDYTGDKIGCLKVLKFVRGSSRGNVWLLRCEICGETRELETSRFSAWRRGFFQSCGCRHYPRGPSHPLFKGVGDMPASFWCRVRCAAKHRNIKFTIEMKEAYGLLENQKFLCALSGVPIGFGKGFRSLDTTASMDRINSKRGYVKGNVQWVHKDLNKMKLDNSQDQFIRWCNLVTQTQKQKETSKLQLPMKKQPTLTILPESQELQAFREAIQTQHEHMEDVDCYDAVCALMLEAGWTRSEAMEFKDPNLKGTRFRKGKRVGEVAFGNMMGTFTDLQFK